MMNYLKTPFTEPFRKATLAFLAIFCVLFAASLIVGVSDNPPGIAISYTAFLFFMLAFTHHMRTARGYLLLFLVMLVGFVVFAVLHNVFYGFGKMTESILILIYLFEVLHVGCFLIALFLCPPGAVIGLIGTVVFLIRNRKFS